MTDFWGFLGFFKHVPYLSTPLLTIYQIAEKHHIWVRIWVSKCSVAETWANMLSQLDLVKQKILRCSKCLSSIWMQYAVTTHFKQKQDSLPWIFSLWEPTPELLYYLCSTNFTFYFSLFLTLFYMRYVYTNFI